MAQLKAPFPYFGGKRKVAELIWDRLGNPRHYIEPFAGSAAVLLARPHDLKPYQTETINDLAGEVTNVWRSILHDPEAVAAAACRQINEIDMFAISSNQLRTRRDFVEWLREDINHYDALRAGQWVWGMCSSIEGNWKRAYRAAPTSRRKGILTDDPNERLSYDLILDRLQPLATRLLGVKVMCGDWTRTLCPATWGQTSVGIFLDPPYDPDIRSKGLYVEDDGNVASDVHKWALENGATYRICVAGFNQEHKTLEEFGWDVCLWKGRLGKSTTEERLWFSPACLTPHEPNGILSLFE